MLTLHDTTQLTKNILKWIGLLIVVIVLLILLYQGGLYVGNRFFPKPPPPPDTKFGKLPPILFPESVSKEQFTYEIDTISGTLGDFPDRAKVYKTVKAVPRLLDLKKIRESISKTSFTSNETFISDTVYSWRDVSRVDKSITINIVSKDFTITSNYLTYPDLFPDGLINQGGAITTATSFLERFGLYPLDLDPNKTSLQLLTMQGTSLFAATSLSTAQLVRIDFFQKDLDKKPIMYPHPPYSTMHFLIGGRTTTQILEGKFIHQTVSAESATYPIITVQKAFEILKANKAYIASYYGTKNTITIKNIYLGYFLGEEKQDFVMPIYVFEGKDGFFAYVPAIQSSWIIE